MNIGEQRKVRKITKLCFLIIIQSPTVEIVTALSTVLFRPQKKKRIYNWAISTYNHKQMFLSCRIISS